MTIVDLRLLFSWLITLGIIVGWLSALEYFIIVDIESIVILYKTMMEK